MSAVTVRRWPSRQDSSPITGVAPSSPYRRLARALSRKQTRKDSLAAPEAIATTPISAYDGGGMDREGAFRSPLFHYTSMAHLPLAISPSPAPISSQDPGPRSRSATVNTPFASSSLARKPSESRIRRKPPPDLMTMSASRESDNRRRALSQPTPPLENTLRRKPSSISSTPRGVPREQTEDSSSNNIIDMRSGTSSPALSQGYPGRTRSSVSPRDALSPLYGVSFQASPIGRGEPRNASGGVAPAQLSPEASRGLVDRSRAATSGPSSSAVLFPPLSSRRPTEDRAGSSSSADIKRPIGRGLLEQQFDHLTTQPSMQAEHPTMERADASESAETLLSLIRQNRGSTQTASTSVSSTGLPRSVSQTLSDLLLENNDSQESATYSIPSTLGSFQLHTVAHPLPAGLRGQQEQDRAQPTDPKDFKSALMAFSTASSKHSLSGDTPSRSSPRSNLYSPSQPRNSEVKHTLDEADIEIVEAQPILEEQTTLIGVRRRLVEEYEELGRRPGRILTSKSSFNMSQVAESSNPRSDGPQRIFEFASEREMRKKAEDLEAREKELTIEALSKAEMAYVRIEIWTESRKGKWIIRGSAENDGYPPEELPRITDPWVIPIDSKGIVRRKKLKSNVELSSTRTIVDCPHCADGRQMGIKVQCRTCDDTTRVEMVYSVQCVVRQASFLPLKLPAVLLLGSKQPHIKYIESTDPGQIIDILRDRAIDGLQSAAERVVKAHHAQHGSRLLMGRATISRRGLLSVSVASSKTKVKRHFDIEDGADGKIVEVRPPPVRSQSTPARTMIDGGRKQSIPQMRGSDTSSSIVSPPPFSNLVRKKLRDEGKSSTPTSYASTPPLLAALKGKPLSPPGEDYSKQRDPGQIKRKKSLKEMFYR